VYIYMCVLYVYVLYVNYINIVLYCNLTQMEQFFDVVGQYLNRFLFSCLFEGCYIGCEVW
jgi:hypothetical protein